MKKWILLVAAGLYMALGSLSPVFAARGASQNGEEFVGPFASWANVKSDYGARGDGVADDTGAFAAALRDLGTSGKSPVLFVPSGTYRVTRTLFLASRIHVSVVGEDPNTTVIRWDGPVGGVLMRLDGVAYSRFDRITWDGAGKAQVLVDQNKATPQTPYFDTGNQYADNIFKDAAYGIRGGASGNGFAETSVIRSQFIRNSIAGIITKNFNALDLFIWNSTFEDCEVGVTNDPGAGNFHVYGSLFKRSKKADIVIGNTMFFSIRNNFSVGSSKFFVAGPIGSASSPTTIQGNTILDPGSDKPITAYNPGSYILLDNVVRSSPGQVSPVVEIAEAFTNAPTADLLSIGNTYTLAKPYKVQGDVTLIDDKVVSPSRINPAIPTAHAPPPNLRRAVFEVAPGANSAAIQHAIDQAAASGQLSPIVHIPWGSYNIDQTLVVPANNDLQIVGDGGLTRLTWTGGTNGANEVPFAVFKFLGPTHARMRELLIYGADSATGVVVEDANQNGGAVFGEQVNVMGNEGKFTGLVSSGLDSSVVEMRDFYHMNTGVGVKVLASNVNIFAGASSNNAQSYEVDQGGKLLVQDMWYETPRFPGWVKLTGSGSFTINGGNIVTKSGLVPSVEISDFKGKVTLLTSILTSRVSLSGSGNSTQVLGVGLTTDLDSFYTNSSPNAQAALLHGRVRTQGGGSAPLADQVKNVSRTAEFIKAMISEVRGASPMVLSSKPVGVTDFRMFRVTVERALVGVHLLGSAARAQ